METTLKRLLTVETESEQLVAKANAERERIIQQALEDSHQKEQQFQNRVPELHTHWLEKAQVRAQQTIAELQKRYAERKARLQSLAEENQQLALEAAVQVFMRVGK